jgi:lipopolysaccharide/colanic/teichoic acid biosynthesis glycosyltransferase
MYDFIKRLLDIMGAIGVMLFFSPVFLVMPLLIRLDSAGPVFYHQRRNGRGGKPFEMFKFRTMVRNADEIKNRLAKTVDGPMFKVRHDPRVTRIGRILRKYSLDELPQVLNILRGDMSFVGPRPLAMEEMSENEAWRTARLSVKPGLTGLWQVRGRETHEFQDWVHYDMEYVQTRSLLLDLRILLMTAGSVLRRKNED